MGLTKLQSRSFLRNMVKARIIATYMNDVGRQRITRYVSKKFEKSSKMSKQFNKEVHRIKELTKKLINKNEENLKNETSTTLQVENEQHPAVHKDDQTNKKSYSNYQKMDIDMVIDKDKNEDNVDANYARKETKLKNLFYVVNKIFHKYQLSKFRSKYRCTTSKSLLMKSSNTNAKEQEAKISSTSMQQIVNDAKATLFYNSIKTNLTAQKPIRTGKGVSEVFGFMEVVQDNEKRSAPITYRFV